MPVLSISGPPVCSSRVHRAAVVSLDAPAAAARCRCTVNSPSDADRCAAARSTSARGRRAGAGIVATHAARLHATPARGYDATTTPLQYNKPWRSFPSPEFAKKFQSWEIRYTNFWRYPQGLTQCEIGGRKHPCQKPLDSSSRFDTIQACDGQTEAQTDT